MSLTREQRIYELYMQALEHEGEEQKLFLDEAIPNDPELRARVDMMLGAAQEMQASYKALEHDPMVGSAIGSYNILEELGSGGMGKVYLAEDTRISRKVAIKFIACHAFVDEIQKRFELEQMALGNLEHSHIARLFETGTTEENHPYFVMEYIDGVPIHKYCNEHRLTLEQRLRLFILVCKALAHAHFKGILHRDIKPGNVLITEEAGSPIPKIIDFGIARLLEDDQGLTQDEISPGSLHYMSPEQAGMRDAQGKRIECDPRTDVYSLGVMLYELIVGRRPMEWDEHETPGTMLRDICETLPHSPAQRWTELSPDEQETLARQRSQKKSLITGWLKGEPGWIVVKAMSKQPDQRYRSPADLADDLERFLAGEPVIAGNPGFAYTFRKLIQRNKARFTLSLTLLLVLFFSIGAFTTITIREKRKTEIERDTAQQVMSFLTGLFEISSPDENRGQRVTIKELLDRGSVRISTGPMAPEARYRLLAVMGRVYRNLGLYDEALPLLETALEQQQAGDAPDEILLKTLCDLSQLYLLAGQIGKGSELAELAEEHAITIYGRDHEKVFHARWLQARALWKSGNVEEGQADMLELLLPDRGFSPNPYLASAVHYDLGCLSMEQGDDERAEHHFQTVLGLLQNESDDHKTLLETRARLAEMRFAQGHHEEALRLNHLLLTSAEPLYGNENIFVARTRERILAGLMATGDFESALSRNIEQLEEPRSIDGTFNREKGMASVLSLVSLFRQTGNYQAALLLMAPYIEKRDINETLWMRFQLAHLRILYEINAMEMFEKNLAILKERISQLEKKDRNQSLLLADFFLLEALFLQEKTPRDAISLLEKAHALYQKATGPFHASTNLALCYLADARHLAGENEQVELNYRTAQENILCGTGPLHPDLAIILQHHAMFLAKTGRNAQAKEMLQEAEDVVATTLGTNHWRHYEIRSLHAALSGEKDRMRAAWQGLKAIRGDHHPVTRAALHRWQTIKKP